MSFSKLDSGIIHSSVWDESYPTRILWVTILAMKDESGFVASSRSGLIRASNITPEEFDIAIEALISPDPDSRTGDYEGKRIQKIEGGWIVLNHEKYRVHSDKQKELNRERVRKYRAKCNDVTNCNVTEHYNTLHCITPALPSVSVSESVSLSDSLSESLGSSSKKTVPRWKVNFEEYLNLELEAYKNLKGDAGWVGEREKYHPNLDVLLTLEKAHVDFWGTEAGWKHKKAERSKTINWKITFQNALSMKCNQVWKQKKDNKNNFGPQNVSDESIQKIFDMELEP